MTVPDEERCAASLDGRRCRLAWDDIAHFRHFGPDYDGPWVLAAVHLAEDGFEWPEAG